MNRLNEIIKALELLNFNLYWLEACQKVYNLSNAEMGYIIRKGR